MTTTKQRNTIINRHEREQPKPNKTPEKRHRTLQLPKTKEESIAMTVSGPIQNTPGNELLQYNDQNKYEYQRNESDPQKKMTKKLSRQNETVQYNDQQRKMAINQLYESERQRKKIETRTRWKRQQQYKNTPRKRNRKHKRPNTNENNRNKRTTIEYEYDRSTENKRTRTATSHTKYNQGSSNERTRRTEIKTKPYTITTQNK